MTIVRVGSSSGLAAAAQSDMEAASSNAVATTPGVQVHHPGHPKAALRFSTSGGTPTIGWDYNVASLADNGTGDFTANFDVTFSAAGNMMGIGNTELQISTTFNAIRSIQFNTNTTTSWRFYTDNAGSGAEDNHAYTALAWWGDLA